MLFPLSYEASLVGVIHLRFGRGEAQLGGTAGELHTLPALRLHPACVPCAGDQCCTGTSTHSTMHGALPERKDLPGRDVPVVLNAPRVSRPGQPARSKCLVLSSAPATLHPATPGLAPAAPGTGPAVPGDVPSPS